MSGPLAGVRVIELAGLGAGPFCGMMLADHGAQVIRIDRLSARALLLAAEKDFLNRSRASFSVDLKSEDGVALVRRLCRSADAVFESYRPGVMERLGLGPDVLLADNPKLVYGRLTGWGQTGPYAAAAGHDINYIALSGVLHATGRAGQRPTPPLNIVGDFGGGGLMLAFGMVAAILSARATGRGQVVDCAMTDGSAVLMSMIYSLRAQGLWQDERGVNLLDSASHYYDTYETADGKFVAIGPIEAHFYRLLLERLGLSDDPDFLVQTDPSRWPRLKARLDEIFRMRTRDEWCQLLEGTDTCFAPVLSLDEAPQHPHNVERGAFVDVEGAMQPAPSPRYSHTNTDNPRPMRSGVERLAAVLAELGYGPRELAALQSRKVVA
jgi:alpha-methylacyl-CoA racemase